MAASSWVVIYETGLVLLSRRSEICSNPGKWCFPGGRVDPGETSIRAAVRELYEECRIHADVDELVYLGSIGEASYYALNRFPSSYETTREVDAYRTVGIATMMMMTKLHRKTMQAIDLVAMQLEK